MLKTLGRPLCLFLGCAAAVGCSDDAISGLSPTHASVRRNGITLEGHDLMSRAIYLKRQAGAGQAPRTIYTLAIGHEADLCRRLQVDVPETPQFPLLVVEVADPQLGDYDLKPHHKVADPNDIDQPHEALMTMKVKDDSPTSRHRVEFSPADAMPHTIAFLALPQDDAPRLRARIAVELYTDAEGADDPGLTLRNGDVLELDVVAEPCELTGLPGPLLPVD